VTQFWARDLACFGHFKMSLRRPRIKTAVNLAALAGGRRKAPDPEEKAADSPKEPEHVEAQPEPDPQEPVVAPESEVHPSEKPDNESGAAGEKNSKNVDVIEPSDEPAVAVEAQENTEPVPVAESPAPVAAGSSGSIGEPRKDTGSVSGACTDLKPLENPFSPPPARPAPLARFKNKFRPNLGENRNRIRRYSGTLMDLVMSTCHFFLLLLSKALGLVYNNAS
jgi:hypothetical protein